MDLVFCKERTNRFQKMMIKVLLLSIVIFQQDPIADTKQKMETANDTTRVLLMTDLCYYYRFANRDSALHYGSEAVSLARKIKFERGLALSLSDLGVIYLDQSDFETARDMWKESMTMRRRMNDMAGIGSIYMKMGVVDFQTGNLDSAAFNFLNALSTFEAIKNVEGVTSALNNVAAIYEQQHRFDKAMDYYRQSFDVAVENKRDHDAGVASINIANIFYQQKKVVAAIRHARRGLGYLNGNAQARGYIGLAHNNLGEYYLQLNRPDSALLNVEEALVIRRTLADSVGIVSSLNNLAAIQISRNEFAAAENNLQLALRLATAKHLLMEQRKIFNTLSTLYSRQGNYQKALDAFKEFHAVNDTLRNTDQNKVITEMNTKYETQKKEQQLAVQQAALKQQQSQLRFNYAVIVALAIIITLLVLIVVLVRSRMKRRQEMLKKESDIRIREAYMDAALQSQEMERRRFAQDLHDGMGQLISALRMQVANISDKRSLEDRMAVVTRSEKLMDDMQAEIRTIAFNLMPQTLIQYGLEPALKEMALRLSAAGNLSVSVSTHDAATRLDELKEISIYRVVQEWVNNVVKYAHATLIEIQLVAHDEEWVITIEDNGNSFDPSILEQGAGHGWQNIQSRLRLIHALLDIDAAAGRRGTTLTLSIPVNTSVVNNLVDQNTQ